MNQLIRSLIVSAAILLPQTGLTEDEISNAARFEILSGWRESVRAGERHIAAAKIDLAEGWKTYWRVPGEGGLPPSFMIDKSANLSAFGFLWPRPEPAEIYGVKNYVYSGQVVLPMIFEPASPGKPISVEGEFVFGVCLDLCVRIAEPVSISLDAEGRRDSRIASALQDLPVRVQSPGNSLVRSCKLAMDQTGMMIEVSLGLKDQGHDYEEVIFEYFDEGIEFGLSSTWRVSESQLMARSPIRLAEAVPTVIDRSKVRVTVLTPETAHDVRGCR